MLDHEDLKENLETELRERSNQLKILIKTHAHNGKAAEQLAAELNRNDAAYALLFEAEQKSEVCPAVEQGTLLSSNRRGG